MKETDQQNRTKDRPAHCRELQPGTYNELLARARKMALLDFVGSLTQAEWELTCAITTVDIEGPIKLWDEANLKSKACRQRGADKLIRALWSYVQSTGSEDPEGTGQLAAIQAWVNRYQDKGR